MTILGVPWIVILWVWCYDDDDEKKMEMIPDIFLRWLMTQGIEFLFQQLAQILMVPARLEHWNEASKFTSENLFTNQIYLALYLYFLSFSDTWFSSPSFYFYTLHQVVLLRKLILLIDIDRTAVSKAKSSCRTADCLCFSTFK